MDSLSALSSTQFVTVAVVALLVMPSGAFAASADDSDPFDEGAVDFARTTEEVKGYVLASVSAKENGTEELAKKLAEEPYHEHWSAIRPRLEGANATLADQVESELESLPTAVEETSPAEYEAYVESELFPLLATAEESVIDDETASSTTFQATVVHELLQRSVHEYHEGVSSAGTVTEAGEVLAAKGYAERSEARYTAELSTAVSEHANDELTELFEHLSQAMDATESPESVEQYSASLSAELAEYTGIEVEQSGSAEAIERIEADLDEAVETYENGEAAEAKAIVKQTYLSNFEGVEGTLIEENPELVEDLEAAFNEDLPSLIDEGASQATVANRVEQMKEKLGSAETILASQKETEITLGGDDDSATNGEVTATTHAGASTTTSTEAPGFSLVTVGIAGLAVAALLIRRD